MTKPKIRQVICLHPHLSLRTPAVEVVDFGELLKHKIDRMSLVMRNFNGVGVAANQCFLPDNIFLTNLDNDQRVFINAKVVDTQGRVRSHEGCLSLPGVEDSLDRAEEIVIEYQNEEGVRLTELFRDKMSVIVQHEMDHLRGKLFLNHLSELKQDIVKRKMLKFKKKMGLK